MNRNQTEKIANQEKEMEFTTITRGKPKLLIEGNCYVKKKELANKVQLYECDKRRKGFCSAPVKIQDNKVVRALNNHSHAPDPSRVVATKTSAEIKQRSRQTLESTQQILQEISNSLISEGVASNMPALENIRRVIRRERRKT